MSSIKYDFYRILRKMGFRENLKSQLEYSNMLVKELAARSGIKKKTIDSYLGNRGYTPSVDAAVSIAKVLGVSVEYLVTGKETADKEISLLLRPLMKPIEQLSKEDRKIIIENALNLAKALQNRNKRL